VRHAIEGEQGTGKKIELIELNEAFAAQSGLPQELNWTLKSSMSTEAPSPRSSYRLQRARILVTLLYEMQKRDVEVGLASLCVGGGMGYAMIVERGWYY
jgi:acetyl-CoA C-acetyltransferase